MKQVMPFLAAVSLIAACKTKSDVNADAAKTTPITTDTTGLAQYQAWKAQHELESTAHYNPQAAIAPVQHNTTTHTSTATHHTATSQPAQTQSSTMSSESANTAKAPEKKGWSKAAKGAAIGAGTGAVVGAVVNKKNRVVGGVVGGVTGGAVGYGIGRHKDKKDGRY